MQEKKIRHQVFIPLTLTFLILTGTFIYSSYWLRMAHYEEGMQKRHAQVQHISKSLVTDRTRYMTSTIEFIADQKQFQHAMQTNNRTVLLMYGAPLLKRLFNHKQITHFYFYDKNGTIVLQMYNPEDTTIPTKPHLTTEQAMSPAKTVSGLKLSPSGIFMLRVISPWKVNGKLIGYIELGQEYDNILQELKSITQADYAVVLEKKYLERGAWEAEMKAMGRNANWDLLQDRVLADITATIPSPDVANLFESGANSKKYGKRITINDRTYRVESFPLQGAAQTTVGEFVTVMDSTDKLAAIRTFAVKVVAFSLLLCGSFFVYSYRVLGGVDRRLLDKREQSERDFEKQASTNKQLEFEVAERRRAEGELVLLNESLEQHVAVRTRELNQLNLELAASNQKLEEAYNNLQVQHGTILQQDRMACIGQLAASVAHDINNPIGFVAGNLEVLKKYWGKLTAFVALQDEALHTSAHPQLLDTLAEQRNKLKVDYVLGEFNAVLDESIEGTERVSRIVLNLKGFSRLNEKEVCMADLHECLESTLNIVMNELRYKADIEKEYGKIPLLLCYPQQLNQVFMNLLINASQAINGWGKITIRTWTEHQDIYVAIGDTGTGITTENIHKLFEPFFSTKEGEGGTGLGLSIVKEIVKKHRGDITVESELGKGTVFTVRLPLEVPAWENGNDRDL